MKLHTSHLYLDRQQHKMKGSFEVYSFRPQLIVSYWHWNQNLVILICKGSRSHSKTICQSLKSLYMTLKLAVNIYILSFTLWICILTYLYRSQLRHQALRQHPFIYKIMVSLFLLLNNYIMKPLL